MTDRFRDDLSRLHFISCPCGFEASSPDVDAAAEMARIHNCSRIATRELINNALEVLVVVAIIVALLMAFGKMPWQ